MPSKHYIATFLALGVFGILSGCSPASLRQGGLYYIKNDQGSYSVLKILKLDDQGVHVRLYGNQFPSPPRKLDESVLFIGDAKTKSVEQLGMGHLALLKKTFEGWNAVFIQQSAVTDSELDGYKVWLDAKGGYF